MALVSRDKHVVEWPTFAWPDRWRRLFDLEGDEGWLRTEEFHDGDTLVVRAEMPGINPEKDVEITVGDGVVRIEARREEKAEHKTKRGYRSEFRYGEFAREIVLPKGSVGDDVKATYSDGILEVRVPCPEKAQVQPHKIPVTQV